MTTQPTTPDDRDEPVPADESETHTITNRELDSLRAELHKELERDYYSLAPTSDPRAANISRLIGELPVVVERNDEQVTLSDDLLSGVSEDLIWQAVRKIHRRATEDDAPFSAEEQYSSLLEAIARLAERLDE